MYWLLCLGCCFYFNHLPRMFLSTDLCISPAPGRSSKLTHTGVEIDTCAFQTGCQLSSAATGMSLELRFFRRDFSGVKRTCWTTGSWRSCLSLEVVSSIPAGSTIIYRFLCGFICVSLCQSIKIKPTNMYVCMYIYMYMCVCIVLCYVLLLLGIGQVSLNQSKTTKCQAPIIMMRFNSLRV